MSAGWRDVVVIGGGPGGYATAIRAAGRGLDVVLVEESQVGGTCLHRGCIPSKAGLHAARLFREVTDASRWGIAIGTDPAIDLEVLDQRRSRLIRTMHRGLRSLLDARVEVVDGRGRMVGDGAVAVESGSGERRELRARHVVLATGSAPRWLPGVEVDGELVQTSDQAVHFTTVPRHAVVVGAGAIGMELAALWHTLGGRVNVVEAADRVLPAEDHDVSAVVATRLARDGIDVLLRSTVQDVTRLDGHAMVTVRTPDGERAVDADRVLIAIGRSPRTGGIGAEAAGVLDDRGYVVTDALGRTAVPGLWAVGDVRPTLALAHAAFAEGFAVADAIAGVPGTRPVDHDAIPRVTFCTPEVASVGLTQVQAEDRFGADAVACTTTSSDGNARVRMEEESGVVKVVALRDGPGTTGPGALGEVLGVHVVGPHATELVADATAMVSAGLLVPEAAASVRAHPTHGEVIGEAILAAAGLPFHLH